MAGSTALAGTLLEVAQLARAISVPEMIAVDSASIEAVAYDAESLQLFVRFRQSARTYVYYGVAEYVFQELMQAQSKGAYFNLRIRPSYRFAELGRSDARL
jgi:hypothetical protein